MEIQSLKPEIEQIKELLLKHPQPPKPVGCYYFQDKNLISNHYVITISLTYKPSFIRRFFIKLFFGIKWKDY